MRYAQAMQIIEDFEQGQIKIKESKGFLITCEKKEGNILHSMYFPDKYFELPIPTEEEAWALARRFAKATVGKYLNIYVVYAADFTPVPNYGKRQIENRDYS